MKFKFVDPPAETVNSTYTISFDVVDVNVTFDGEVTSGRKNFEVSFTVIEKLSYGDLLKQKTESDRNPEPLFLEFEISQPNLEGKVDITFNSVFRLAKRALKWTSENEGSRMITVEYEPSE